MSVKEKLIGSVAVGSILFMMLSIIYKLVDNKPNWLPLALIWSLAWAVGYFVAKTISDLDMGNIKSVEIYILITIVVGIIASFVLGVVCNFSNWIDIALGRITLSLFVSLLVNHKWIKS